MAERQEDTFEDGVGGLTAGSEPSSQTPDIRSLLARARALLEENRPAEAELACRDILTADPHNFVALALLYRALLRLGRIDEAAKLYAQGDWVSKLTPGAQQNLALSLSVAERRQFIVRLSQALTVGDLKSARETYASARSEWREDWNIQLLHARLLLAEGDAQGAERESRLLQADGNRNPNHLFVLCKAIAQQRRGAEARELFIQSIWSGPFTPEQKGALLQDVAKLCTADEIHAFLEHLEALRPATVSEQTRMAMAELRIGRPEAAARRLEAMESSTGKLTEVQTDQLIKALIDAERFDDALKRLQFLRAEAPEHPVWAALMAKLHIRRHDSEALSPIAIECLKMFPRSVQFVEMLSILRLAPEAFAQITSQVLDDWRSVSVVPARASVALARAALHARDTHAAIEVLQRDGAASTALDDVPRDLQRALSLYPADFWTECARFRDDMRQPVQVVRVPDARATVVVFPSLGGCFGKLPFDYLDALLSRHPVNVIYLRDHKAHAFLDPAPDLGGSSEGLVKLLLQWKQKLGGLPLINIGTSSGGFAAARYGVWADANSVISFAGPTKLFSSDDRPSDSRQRIGLAFLRSIPAEVRDVVPGLAARPRLGLWHVAGALNPNDQLQQARVRELDNVTAHTIPHVKAHNTFLPALNSGLFDALIAEAIEDACG